MLDALVLDLDDALTATACVEAEVHVEIADLVGIDLDTEVTLEAGDEVDVDGAVRAAL